MALGRCGLARGLLPKERDNLRRGRLLQQALRTAIDRLAPIGTRSNEGKWSYLIAIGEYEEGRPRLEVQSSLAISKSAYTRAKRAGLERIAAMLPYLILEGPTAMDNAAWMAYLDTLTPRERSIVQNVMARISHILNSDRVQTAGDLDAADARLDRVDIDAENERIGAIERGCKREQESTDALHEEVHDLGDRVAELEHPHEG